MRFLANAIKCHGTLPQLSHQSFISASFLILDLSGKTINQGKMEAVNWFMWSKIEEDLATKVPSYIKNGLL